MTLIAAKTHQLIEKLGGSSPGMQWIVLIVFSVVLGLALTRLNLPAALLLGPLLAGIAFSVGGVKLSVPRQPFALAQGIIGCMIAKIISPTLTASAIGNWPVFLGSVLSVVAASFFLAWLMTRLEILPGTTSAWGLSPGAATAMTLMAEAYGADVQLVALMQYMRAFMVVAMASIVAGLFGVDTHHDVRHILWFAPTAWGDFAKTLVLTVAGIVVAQILRVRAGALLLPLIAGSLLSTLGLATIELPHWLLAISYAFVGWSIGLRFSPQLLSYAAKSLPRILLCIFCLIGACIGLAFLLVVIAGVDPLTAYLATSPGGADTVAIIAASSHVDASFVMATQIARFLTVLLLGPPVARLIAKRNIPGQLHIQGDKV